MGNRLCCGGRWSCPSVLQRKKKSGNQTRGIQKLQKPLQQKHTKVKRKRSSEPEARGPGSAPKVRSHSGMTQHWQERSQPGPSASATQASQGPDTASQANGVHSRQPESREKSTGVWSTEDSTLHYADIQICSRPTSRLARKHVPMEKPTEYAVLRFPQATPRDSSKKGTLV